MALAQTWWWCEMTVSIAPEIIATATHDVVLEHGVSTTVVEVDQDVAVVTSVELAPQIVTRDDTVYVVETAAAQGPPGPGTNEAFDLDLNAIYQIAKL